MFPLLLLGEMEARCRTDEEKIKYKTRKIQCLILLGFAVLMVVAGVTCLLMGVVKYNTRLECESERVPTDGTTLPTPSILNSDQKKLEAFAKKIKTTFYTLHPDQGIMDPSSQLSEIFETFQPYNPSWKAIKHRTDTALRFNRELEELNVDRENLKPREKKALSQLRHYLDSIFGNPFDENYYSGDWMLGPNFHCWQPFCNIGHVLMVTFNKNSVAPFSLRDVEKLMAVLIQVGSSIKTFKENMMLGVMAGMVRSVEACAIGRNAFERKFPMVKERGADAVLLEAFSVDLIDESYYSRLSDDEKTQFTEKYNKTIKDQFSQILIDQVGAPLHDFLQFLQKNHSRYCVPSSIASGLANLPLKHVWLDQNETNIKTTQVLPTGEKLFGANSYKKILPYFTTVKNYNTTYIHKQGQQQLEILYKRAVAISKKITKENDSAEAVRKFKEELRHPRHYFNTTQIPDNENGYEGGSRCKDMETAKQNCPVRYEAMKNWMKYTYEVMAQIDFRTIGIFHMTGDKATTPGCPVRLAVSFNPAQGSHYYEGSGHDCVQPAKYTIPFFLDKPGPKFISFSLIGHETRPGHHTQMQGFYERFQQSDEKDVFDWLNVNTFYVAFTEGWALYAENPLLATDTDLYKDELMQEYGMLKLQIWRALRMVIDTGLHERGMTLTEALGLFEKYAWDTTDKALKDTIRYMGLPGQATSYMIGQVAIWNLRNKTEETLRRNGIYFDLKEFHYQILSQGSAPLDYLIEYMNDYTECKIDPLLRKDCFEILTANNRKRKQVPTQQRFERLGTKEKWNFVMSMKQAVKVLD